MKRAFLRIEPNKSVCIILFTPQVWIMGDDIYRIKPAHTFNLASKKLIDHILTNTPNPFLYPQHLMIEPENEQIIVIDLLDKQ